MVKTFAFDQLNSIEILDEIKKLLTFHSMTSKELIHQYYLEQYEQKGDLPATEGGHLTIKCSIDDLCVNVMIFFIYFLCQFLINHIFRSIF